MVAETVYFVGPLPPPVTGLANANLAVCERLDSAGIPLTRLNLSPPLASGALRHHLFRAHAVLRAVRDILRKPPGIVYMSVDGGHGIIYGIAIHFLCRLLNLPTISHHHSFSYVDRQKGLMKYYLRAGSLRQRHIYLCRDMMVGFEKNYKHEIQGDYIGLILPNTALLPVEAAGSPTFTRDTQLTISHLSNLSHEKGTDIFLDLLQDLLKDGVAVRGILAGPIQDNSLRERVAKMKLAYQDNFLYLGPVYGEGKNQFFHDTDVFVFPTRYVNEAQPLVLIEALLGGAVLISADRGCIGCDHGGHESLIIRDISRFVGEAGERLRHFAKHPEDLSAARRAAHGRAIREASAAAGDDADWMNMLRSL